MKIPNSLKQLSSRYKTQAGLTRKNYHEFHDLSSLSKRLMLSPQETLNVVAEGKLLSLDEINGQHMFSANSLDAIRNQVIDIITENIVTEMSGRYGEDSMLLAFDKAITKQYQFSRGSTENLIQFDYQDPNDPNNPNNQNNPNNGFYANAKRGAGFAAGALGASGLFRAAKFLYNQGQNGTRPVIDEKGAYGSRNNMSATLQTHDFESRIQQFQAEGMDQKQAHIKALKEFALSTYETHNLQF